MSFDEEPRLPEDFASGSSEMARLVRAKDWSRTPLGPIAGWPQSLRTVVSLCLASNFPINIVWGPERTQIYNDGYRIVCGEAHPRALGESYAMTWASAWPAIGEPFAQALGGTTSFLENQRMFLTRNGYLEETFFTFSLSPIRDESGGIGGLFHPVTETTATMLAERRTRAIRDMIAALARVASVDRLAAAVVATLARHAFDLPFMLVYTLSDDAATYVLAATHDLVRDTPLSPSTFAADAPLPWAAWSDDDLSPRPTIGALACLDGLRAASPGIAADLYEEGCDRAFVAPIAATGAAAVPMILVLGVSPRLPLDDTYRGFHELVAASLTAALASVRAREDERRRAEALSKIDRTKTAFFSNISHEFRTPLTLLLGPLEEVVARGAALPVDVRESLTLALRNAERLAKMVNALLDFSRIEAGRMKVHREAVDLSAAVRDLASQFRSACDRAGLVLTVDAPPLREPVWLDRDLLETIVLNLLSNAFKFTLGGGITVGVAETPGGDAARVVVADTGSGIPVHELPLVFERFHRVAGTRGRSFEGSGIGLSLVRELVQLQGGSIDVESTADVGSRFTVTLPFGRAHLPAAPIRTGGEAGGDRRRDDTRSAGYVKEAIGWLPVAPLARGTGLALAPTHGTVLLADDNADMRGYVERLLTAEGYRVVAVADGVAALAAADHERPDLVLSDAMMPNLDGFGLLAAWRASAFSDVPFILLSARAGEEARIEGLDAGADDYLGKPFSARELVARVNANLHQARTRREAATRDVQQRLQTINAELERQVVERSKELGRSWQMSPDLLAVLAPDGTIEGANPAWMATLGRATDDLVGQPIFDAMADVDRDAARAVFASLRADAPMRRQTDRWATCTGEVRWLDWTAVTEGAAVYFSGRDVTDEKAREAELAQTQEALRQSQKMEAVGQLTGGLAHDFNNLLTGISGSLELLQMRIGQGRADEANRYIVSAQGAAKRAAALTHRLLAFSRRQTLSPKPTEVNRLIAGMAEMVRRTIGPQVLLDVVTADDAWAVSVDPNQLENALLNLCINARDAMPDGGLLTIETANKALDEHVARGRDLAAGQYLAVCVTDNGTGMTSDVADRAFEPFFTTKPIGGGTGLGLSMVYGFARQSEGQVRIHSEPGRGSTICIYLPRLIDANFGAHSGAQVATGVVARVVEAVPAAIASSALTILVIDDDTTVRMLVAEKLGELGYAVIEAADGAIGLGVLRTDQRVDLLVTDVGLPGQNGRQVADAARGLRPALDVLFITGYAENAVLNNGILAPGMQVLTKPFSMEALAARVQAMLPR